MRGGEPGGAPVANSASVQQGAVSSASRGPAGGRVVKAASIHGNAREIGYDMTASRVQDEIGVRCGRAEQHGAVGGRFQRWLEYSVFPSITGVTHVWHTPLRHEYRVGTSHASANSRSVWKPGDQLTLSPLRAKVIRAPAPAHLLEGVVLGRRRADDAGVDRWQCAEQFGMDAGGIDPGRGEASRMPSMNVVGPQRYAVASVGRPSAAIERRSRRVGLRRHGCRRPAGERRAGRRAGR